MFRRRVNARLRKSNMSGDARRVNNGASPGLGHRADFMLHRIQDAPHVDVESPAILFFGHLIQRSHGFDTGIVEGHIETAMGGQGKSMAFTTSASLATSARTKAAVPPFLVIAAATSAPSFSRRLVRTTLAPAS